MTKITRYLLFSHILLFFFFYSRVEGLDAEGLIGGEGEEEIRYLVSVQLNGNHTCSGAIIGDKYVVTAAHCLVKNSNNEFTNEKVKIVADVEDLLAYESARIESDVEEIYVPSVYDGTHWAFKYPEGDIAVLKLKQQFDLSSTDGLKKLRLPKAGEDNFPLEYVMAVVSGYSAKEVITHKYKNGTAQQDESQYAFSVDVLVVDNRTCKRYWQSHVTEKNLCAKVMKTDHVIRGPCKGDSGNPLVYGSDLLIGIASGRVSKCFNNTRPVLYTRLSSYRNFVANAIKGFTVNMRMKILTSNLIE